MLRPEDRELQANLIKSVVSFEALTFTKEVPTRFKIVNAERLAVYRQSFLGRVVSSLPEVVLSPACCGFGFDLVKEITARYFSHVRPHDYCIVRALSQLPEFVESQSEGEMSLFFADVIRYCLLRWRLIYEEDPQHTVSSPHFGLEFRLSHPVAFVFPKGNYDLYAAIQEVSESLALKRDQAVLAEIAAYCHQARGILLVKNSFDDLQMVAVPNPLKVLTEQLMLGLTIGSALETIDDANLDAIDEQDLLHFLQELQISHTPRS